MLIRVDQVSLPLGLPESDLPARACARIGADPAALRRCHVVRRSLDARHQNRIRFVYTMDLDLPDDVGRLRLRGARPLPDQPEPEEPLIAGTQPLPGPVVIVGAGPAGLFAALRLAEHGYAPLVLERGQPVERRIEDLGRFRDTRSPDPDSNLLFGEGGAGTFSDGKLTTRIGDRRVRHVLETLVGCGAPDDVLIDAMPHIGTDRLREIIPRLRARIEAAGGAVRFGCRVDGLVIEKRALVGVRAAGTRIRAGLVCLAIGHSARDTYRMLAEAGVPLAGKPFQMGLRIEHRQADLDRARYGPDAGHPDLPPAHYQLVARGRDIPRPVATFCMCPGGVVVPAVSEPGRLCTNGMSDRTRSGPFANSGLVVTVEPRDVGAAPLAGVGVPVLATQPSERFLRGQRNRQRGRAPAPLDGVEFQRRWEGAAFDLAGGDYTAPAQRVGDFLAERTSAEPIESTYPLGVRPVSMRAILPPLVATSIARAMPILARRLSIFADAAAVLVGPETRASSPVRILRDPETRASTRIAGLYPVGEGAGYAGGIMSAAVDGLRTAETIIRTFAPPA